MPFRRKAKPAGEPPAPGTLPPKPTNFEATKAELIALLTAKGLKDEHVGSGFNLDISTGSGSKVPFDLPMEERNVGAWTLYVWSNNPDLTASANVVPPALNGIPIRIRKVPVPT